MYSFHYILTTTIMVLVQSQPHNNQSNTSNITDNATISIASSMTYYDTFNLDSVTKCSATIVQTLQFDDYTKKFASFQFKFINGVCKNPTLWYSYYPLYYDGISSDFVFNMIYANDYGLNVSCRTNTLCTQVDFCVSNYQITVNNSNNKTSHTTLEFHTSKTNYVSSSSCYGMSSMPLMTVLCGGYNFTKQEFVYNMINDNVIQCGAKSNPYLQWKSDPTTTATTTTKDIDVDTNATEAEPICVIQLNDNWITWIIFGICFVFVSISLFFCMTRYAGIEVSIKKWGAILMLFMSSLAISSIFRALITTFISMAGYQKCNTLQSKAPLTPWDWEEDWEKDSLMGFWFWIIGVCISSAIYALILTIKFNMRSVSQYQYSKIDCGEKFIVWCIKGLFFIVTFSFSAVLRPYYYVGRHSEWGDKCACVDGNIALIAEIYGAALISILLAPCAYKCGRHFLTDDDEKHWLMQVIGCLLMLYAMYCAFIVLAAPFLFIAFRIIEYVNSAEHLFTSDDFTMFIWFFEAVSNFFVDLTN